jgi:ribosomal protein S18 acetylase RimI-like enzyme
LFAVAEAPNGGLMGYNLGKAEGDGKLWHGHVSAVTVAPAYRRLGLAKTLMDDFEHLCINTYSAYFVDLFVRTSNHLAQKMYEKFGYSTYRRVLGYYSGKCAFDVLSEVIQPRIMYADFANMLSLIDKKVSFPRMPLICGRPCRETGIKRA